MSQYYLAVDIGTSSGRHMLACIQDGKIKLEEIYHFENGIKRVDGKLLWYTEHLLNENNHVVGDSYGYRDYRTDGMNKVVNKGIDEKELYAKTDF